MCEWVPEVEKSPDRIDALVWATTKLTQGFLQHENIDLTNWIHTMPRKSMDRNARRSAYYPQTCYKFLNKCFRICTVKDNIIIEFKNLEYRKYEKQSNLKFPACNLMKDIREL